MKCSFQIKAYLEVDLLGLYFFMVSHIVLDYKLQSNQLYQEIKGFIFFTIRKLWASSEQSKRDYVSSQFTVLEPR